MPRQNLFAAIGHPRDLVHFHNNYNRHCLEPLAFNRDEAINRLKSSPPFVADYWPEIIKTPYTSISGIHIIAPITSECLVQRPKLALQKIQQAIDRAVDMGVSSVSLGGIASIIYRDFSKPESNVRDITISSGNSLTVAFLEKQILEISKNSSISLANQTVSVIGASGDIGRAICLFLAPRVKNLTIFSRNIKKINNVKFWLQELTPNANINIASDIHTACMNSDLSIFTTSTPQLICEDTIFKGNSHVIDVGYPKNIHITRSLRGITVYDGGLAAMPKSIDFSVDTGLVSPNLLFGCYAEALTIAATPELNSASINFTSVSTQSSSDIYNAAIAIGVKPAPIELIRRTF